VGEGVSLPHVFKEVEMANAYKLYVLCSSCAGTKKKLIPVSDGSGGYVLQEVVCTECQGSGVKFYGYCTEAVTNESLVP
jgi:DnaJ-class molecular chaperone